MPVHGNMECPTEFSNCTSNQGDTYLSSGATQSTSDQGNMKMVDRIYPFYIFLSELLSPVSANAIAPK